ncbi:MAG: FAD-dependent oxidoreductase, partial [Parcubacteria group bacterium]|nr:FAD-dependent oxidoreductase [Parcubacteria group bacterium]
EKIYLISREQELRAEPVNMEQMKKLGDRVEVISANQVQEIVGQNMLEKVVLSRPYKGSSDLKIDGLFVEIGFDPDTTLSEQLGVALDEKRYIIVDNMMRTNIPGVFAAGDCTNHFGSFKQDITASAMGAVAATSAYEYFKTHS